ncbi:hypothetical protein MKX03_010117, partial [Papaver bracteatum]
ENPYGSHWTLLEYDFSEGEWNFFNSLSSYKVKCKNQAVQMATACIPYLIQRYDNLKLSAEVVDINRGKLVYKDITSIKVHEQGSYPDCLINVCYYMKMRMKLEGQKKWEKLTTEQAISKVNKKKLGLAVKMLTDVGNSWAINVNEDYWDSIPDVPIPGIGV